jgi:hypothetical protein
MSQWRSGAQIGQDLKWGLSYSAGITAFLAAPAIAGRLVIGPELTSGLSFTTVLIDYGILGVAAGVLAGLGRPLTVSMPGVALLGAVLGVISGLPIRVAAVGWVPWGNFDLLMMAMFAVSGAATGVAFRRGVLRGEAKLRDASPRP